MKTKKWKCLGIILAVSAALAAGCGGNMSENAKTDTTEESTERVFQTRVGTKVPDAFKETTEEPEDVKAKNFDYEEDNMDYKLVWSDEFDYEGMPDESKWGYDIGTGSNGWGNQELQYYTDEGNAWVEDGKLVIELRKEEKEGCEYTSARLVTKGKGDWTYGKIEVCAKLPSGRGTWPAIWMLPTDWVYGGWPASGEIDIMEHVGYDPDVIHGSIHTQSYYHSIGTQKTNTVTVPGVSDDFHVYGLEWLPDKIKISVDGEAYFSFTPTDFVENPTYKEWPFDEKMHLILNIAFGGGWGGCMGIDDEILPQRMEVDYVRVYQSPKVSDIKREERVPEQPFLKADGKLLRDNFGAGEIVQLKGTNAGGYLLQEFWMTTTGASKEVAAEEDIYRILTERFGEETCRELIALYQDNYWTEADFDYCKQIGMNCIRLPLWYRNLVDENGTFYENWSERLDWFVEQAAKRQIYVILDMHGAPGSQNGSDHSGRDGKENKEAASEFFFGEHAVENQEQYYEIWEKIAEHFRENPWVAGYDLLNEPYCTYRYNSSKTAEELHQMLWGIYDTVYQRIRAVDPDHVLIMEATWDPVDLPDPSDYGWENVMYEYHNYLYDDYDNQAGKQITNMKKKLDAITSADYKVPSYLGEFSYFNSLDAWDEGINLLNESGINWTTWTYKVVEEYGNWGIRNQKNDNLNLETASEEEIRESWSAVGTAAENTGLRRVLEKYYWKEYIAP